MGKLVREKMLLYDALRKYMWKMLARFKDVMDCSVLITSSEDDVHSEQNTDGGSVKSSANWVRTCAIYAAGYAPEIWNWEIMGSIAVRTSGGGGGGKHGMEREAGQRMTAECWNDVLGVRALIL
jgi:hypothetical protein